MNLRKFGKTGRMVSEIGLGTWQLGTKWGEPFNESEAMRILETAADCGITLIDTADIYNKSNSELTIGKFLSKHKGAFYVVTKCGRGLNPHVAEGYTPENVEHFIDNSLGRLGVEQLDMVLLHCPPSSVYCNDELFSGLDKIVNKGKIAAYGVSVEKVSEGLKAMDYNISAIEVIFNMFRLKPLEKLLPEAKERDIGILARVPLASGLLTGKFNKDTVFGQRDHRNFNRHGESFDKGETFSGVDYETGLRAVEELKKLFSTQDLAPYALRWILMHDEVSAVIPGASRAEQVIGNVKAAEIPALTAAEMDKVTQIYNKYIKASVHENW